MLPHTTKRTTANLKIKNNQNFQKIKLYGSPTTKELKKKHSSRPVGGAKTGRWVERTRGKVAACGLGSPTWAVPHSHADKLGETLGSETDCTTQGCSVRK